MKLQKQREALALRKSGHSMREIAERLRVSKSSVSLWVRSAPMSPKSLARIRALYTAGQVASQETHRRIAAEKASNAKSYAKKVIDAFSTNMSAEQVLCAMVYWCEGSKMYLSRGTVSFTNSDPVLVKTFLRLLRKSFPLDESKFRVCLHLHGYHDEKTQLKFWSKTATIPLKQFMRPYRKKESAISIRKGYQGCVQIRYYDTELLRKLLAIAQTYMAQMQGL